MNSAQQNYLLQMLPHAKISEAITGIPAALIASMWSWETAFGTNASSAFNNEGGIKAGSSGKDGVAPGGIYAAYNSIDNFAKDWGRILMLNDYGYPAVIHAAQTGQPWEQIVTAFNASEYAGRDYNVTEIVNRAKWLQTNEGSSPVATVQTSSGGSASFSTTQLTAIGSAFVGLLLLAQGGSK